MPHNQIEQRRAKVDKLISKDFDAKYMNNSKWVKLFDALVENFHLSPFIRC